MKKILLFCTLVLLVFSCSFSVSAKSPLTYFSTVIDLGELDEAARAEYFKKASPSFTAGEIQFVEQEKEAEANTPVPRFSSVKEIIRLAAQ